MRGSSGDSPTDPPNGTRQSTTAWLGLGPTVTADEAEAIQSDPEAFVVSQLTSGVGNRKVRERLELSGMGREDADSLVQRLARANGQAIGNVRNRHRTRNTIISIFVGFLIYVVVVVAFMFAGRGGLVIQVPAFILAVVLGRDFYMYIRRPAG